MAISSEQNLIHYNLEKELTTKIMNAAPEDRARVSLEDYDELSQKSYWHSGQFTEICPVFSNDMAEQRCS